MGRKRSWTDEDLTKAVAESQSFREIILRLGLVVAGGQYDSIKSHCSRLGLSLDHLKGQSHGSSKNRRWRDEDIYVKDSPLHRSSLKKRALLDGIIKNECAICEVKSEWMGQPLMCVLDHINGDGNDHRLKNLRMLCPNCNSQQDTFAGRNIKRARS